MVSMASGNNVELVKQGYQNYAEGNVDIDDEARINGDVYVGGNVNRPNRVTGNIYPYEGWPSLIMGSVYTQTWQMMRQ